MRHRGIVYRKYLDELLAGNHRPVDHLFKVEEFAYAEVVFAAQCKHRYCYAGSAPGGFGVDKTLTGHFHHGCRCGRFYCHMPVLTTFPGYELTRFALEDYKLIFEFSRERGKDYGARPCGEICVGHRDGFFRVPATQCLRSSAECDNFVGCHHRCVDGDEQFARFQSGGHCAVYATAHTACKHHRVVWFIPGLVLPAVENLVVGSSCSATERMGFGAVPFEMVSAPVVATHNVMVVEILGVVRKIYLQFPRLVSVEAHRNRFLRIAFAELRNVGQKIERLAPLGAIVDVELYVHGLE